MATSAINPSNTLPSETEHQFFSGKKPLICQLASLGIIRVQGEDARSFMQSQFSNDMNEVSLDHAGLGTYSNPKGRCFANFVICQKTDNDFFLILHNGVLDTLLKRLSIFVMRSKVELSDVSHDYSVLGLIGTQTGSAIELPKLPEQALQQTTQEDEVIIKRCGTADRYQWIMTRAKVEQILENLSDAPHRVSELAWQYQDIVMGLPQIGPNSIEAWIPQMLNQHAIGAISFDKGCFPGQEIVARLKYLGENQRLTYLLHSTDRSLPAENSPVQNAAGKDIGNTLQAAPAPDGGYVALAVLKVKQIDEGLSINNSAVKRLDLPYSLD